MLPVAFRGLFTNASNATTTMLTYLLSYQNVIADLNIRKKSELFGHPSENDIRIIVL